jgi:hypothetical protein
MFYFLTTSFSVNLSRCIRFYTVLVLRFVVKVRVLIEPISAVKIENDD